MLARPPIRIIRSRHLLALAELVVVDAPIKAILITKSLIIHNSIGISQSVAVVKLMHVLFFVNKIGLIAMLFGAS